MALFFDGNRADYTDVMNNISVHLARSFPLDQDLSLAWERFATNRYTQAKSHIMTLMEQDNKGGSLPKEPVYIPSTIPGGPLTLWQLWVALSLVVFSTLCALDSIKRKLKGILIVSANSYISFGNWQEDIDVSGNAMPSNTDQLYPPSM